MDTVPKKRLQVIVILLIALFVVAGIIFYATRQAAPLGGSKNGGIVNVELSQIPSGFPSDIPFFFQTQVLQNYYTTSTEGVSQATRQFEASSSAPVIYKMYEDFFLKAGWNVSPQYHPKIVTQEIFYATKGSDQATVIVDSVLTTTDVKDPHRTIVTLNFFTKP